MSRPSDTALSLNDSLADRDAAAGPEALTVANAHVSGKIHQMLLRTDDLGAETISLASVDFPSLGTRGNAARILPSVLENGETIVDILNSRRVEICENNRENSTHSESIKRLSRRDLCTRGQQGHSAL
jgi:hypothetical protein